MVVYPVHFRPDPDPAIQNLKNRIRILLAHFRLDPDPANQNFKTGSGSYWHSPGIKSLKSNMYIFFTSISSDTWMMIFLPEKIEKFTWKCLKALFLKYLFLVYTTLHCQSTDRIRIRWKFSGFCSGSGSFQKGPDPTGSGSATLHKTQGLQVHIVSVNTINNWKLLCA